jgi:hypothetical protein
MLLEVPSMAANPLNPKKRIISKSFHRILDTQNRQVCVCVCACVLLSSCWYCGLPCRMSPPSNPPLHIWTGCCIFACAISPIGVAWLHVLWHFSCKRGFQMQPIALNNHGQTLIGIGQAEMANRHSPCRWHASMSITLILNTDVHGPP